MRVGIDARMLGPQCGGLGRYTQQLIDHLITLSGDDEYVLFLKKDNWELVPEHPKIRKVLADIHWYGWEEQFRFLRILKKEQIDLMHFPHWNVPLFYNDPFVVTVHDLLLMHYPTREASTLGWFRYAFKYIAYKVVLAHAVKKAKHIFTPSEFTRQDVHKTLNVSLDKMSVTYEAYLNHKTQDTNNSVLKKFNIAKPYVLYVGVAFPHKNLKGLLNAWKIIEKTFEDEYQLVLVGKKNYFYEKLLKSEEIKQCNNVVYTDFVSDDELLTLYKHATLYTFPSLYEGFGLPPLEAMSHGVPVVSSNRTCLPEILGEAALYADPEDHEQFASAIERALVDEDIRFELKQKGVEELKRYSWKRMAEETLDVYSEFLVKK